MDKPSGRADYFDEQSGRAERGGARNRVKREMEPGEEGDGVGSERRKARGGRLDASGRLFGRPEASNQTARGG